MHCLAILNSLKGTTGKYILRHLVETRANTSPSELARHGTALHSPSTHAAPLDLSLLDLCTLVIREFPAEAEHLRRSGGDDPVVNKLIGVVMQRTRGRADARAVGLLLQSILTQDTEFARS
jgi:aspartyl-tRNA(Asn)/glutamyl-tRNA(Gln) amidotransferase subunit B